MNDDDKPVFTAGKALPYAPPGQFEQVKDYIMALPVGPAGPIMRAGKVGQALMRQMAQSQALRSKAARAADPALEALF